MQGFVFSADCPSRKILLNLTNRWSILILVALREKRLRFNELKKMIDGISEKMLSQTLKLLEHDGFIIRQDYQEIPPHVDYQLTKFGLEASERLFEFTFWLEKSLPQILEFKKEASSPFSSR